MLRKSLLVYSLLVFALFFLLSTSLYTFTQLAEYRTSSLRKQRIESVYQSLNLEDSYRPVKYDVFGDRRPYGGDPAWAKGRSQSSSIEYAHNDTPANTIAALKQKLSKAGFSLIGTAYENSTSPQWHFKNAGGTYVRVTVTSKFAQDALVYGMFNENDPLINHKDEAPSYVTIKVNLDDNNE